MIKSLIPRAAVIVDTNSYSGNFERELYAFVTGFVGNYYPGGCEELAEEGDLVGKYPAVAEWINDFRAEFPSDDRDDLNEGYVKIWPTPGRYNDGQGKHFDIEKDSPKPQYPAYESVAMFFDEVPPVDVVRAIVEQVKLYSSIKRDFVWKGTSFKIKKIKVVEFKVRVEEIETELYEEEEEVQ